MRVDDVGKHAGARLRADTASRSVPTLRVGGPDRSGATRAVAVAVAVAAVVIAVVLLPRAFGHDAATGVAGPEWQRLPLGQVFGRGVFTASVAGNDHGFAAVVTREDRGRPRARRIQVWSSTDGREWTRRLTLPSNYLSGFVASTPTRFAVLAAGGARLRHVRGWSSDDGVDWQAGRAFRGPSQPYVVSDGRSFGADAMVGRSGGAWSSAEGQEWRHTGGFAAQARLGARRGAFTVVGLDQSTRALATTTGGRWSVTTDLPERLGGPLVADPSRRRFYAIRYEPGLDIAGGRLMTSRDLRTWREITSFHEQFPNGNPDHIVRSGDGWVLGGNENAGNRRRATMWVTSDLRHWSEMPDGLRGPESGGSSVLLAAHGDRVVGVSPVPGGGALWIWRRPS